MSTQMLPMLRRLLSRQLHGCLIHRHTGGLENSDFDLFVNLNIHRHTGGLEKFTSKCRSVQRIHRHTGGLEI